MFLGGRVETAVQLHMVQRITRQLTAEFMQMQHHGKHSNVDYIPLIRDSSEVPMLLCKNDRDFNEGIDQAIQRWERNLCRQEGMMMKRIREGALTVHQ